MTYTNLCNQFPVNDVKRRMRQLPRYKLDLLRADYLTGCQASLSQLSAQLELHKSTIGNYRRMFRLIGQHYPEKLHDPGFRLRIVDVKAENHELNRALVLEALLPEILDTFSGNTGYWRKPLYQAYLARCTDPYSYKLFISYYLDWRERNHICKHYHLRIKAIPPADLAVFKRWRKFSYLAAEFKRAFAILASYEGMPLKQIAATVDKKTEVVSLWFEQYRQGGIAALERKKYTLGPTKAETIKTKQDKLLKLLHEPPKNYDINRTGWRLEDLARVYTELYGEPIGKTTVKTYLNARNYGFKKSRVSLTSTDPKFREKLDHIKHILSRLGKDEAFFSIDEYGHFGVKLKGGRTFMPKKELKIVPQVQQSRGVLLVTAALELATNQVTHFYSKNKNTEEMIKLIDILRLQYPAKRNLYLSWDGAIWHNSKLLKAHLEQVNAQGPPSVHLAPLPTSAQFLNVIESVFSGLARSVIHNSDYATVEECMTAIDRHFAERNAYFLANPKQAGQIIWGKELVKPQFNELNQCDKKK